METVPIKTRKGKKESRQFTLKDFCSEFPQDRTTGEKRRAKAKYAPRVNLSIVMEASKMMPLPKPKEAKVEQKAKVVQKAIWVRKDKKLNAEAAEFVPAKMSCASLPFVVNYQSSYLQTTACVLPYVVPNNVYWKQVAGDAMFNWVKMFHGDMTGKIVAMILDQLNILEIRCMLVDFNHLLMRAGQAQQALVFTGLPVVQAQPEDAKLKAIIEDDSEDTVSTDMSFVQERETPKERLDAFLNSLGN